MAPFPNTRAIPDGWSEHLRPTVEATFAATADITRAGTGEGTRGDNGQVIPPAATTVEGGVSCSVQSLATADRVVMVGEEPVTLRAYLVQIPEDSTVPRIGDLVTLTDAPGDEALEGRSLTVRDVQFGSESWSRDLVCVDDN